LQFSSSISSPRDHGIDLIKGLACLLMVAAHVQFQHAPWLAEATMATVLFFASTGMNLHGLVERRRGDELRIGGNALFLIFAGFADNYVQGTMGMSDVFQSAGMAMLALMLLRWLLPVAWTWLFPLPFLIHFANQYVFHWRTTADGLGAFFLAPGLFPLLPWLSFYLLGAHLKRYNSAQMRLTIAAVSLAGIGLLRCFRPFNFDKFWMSVDYLLVGFAVMALLLEGTRRWVAHRPKRPPMAELRFWGANSLVFYILHAFVLKGLGLYLHFGPLLFGTAVVLTALLLRAGLKAQAWAKHLDPWPVLLGGATLAALVLSAEAWVLHSFYLRTFASFGLTFAFILTHPAWKNVTARWPRRAIRAQRQPTLAAYPATETQ
jgi:hypothetical protein